MASFEIGGVDRPLTPAEQTFIDGVLGDQPRRTGHSASLTNGQRKTVFHDLTPAQENAVGRLQFVGVLVLVVGIVGSGILDRLLHINALLAVGIVFAVFALNVIIITVLVARVLGVSSLKVAREGLQSVRDDARQTLARARGRLRR